MFLKLKKVLEEKSALPSFILGCLPRALKDEDDLSLIFFLSKVCRTIQVSNQKDKYKNASPIAKSSISV